MGLLSKIDNIRKIGRGKQEQGLLCHLLCVTHFICCFFSFTLQGRERHVNGGPERSYSQLDSLYRWSIDRGRELCSHSGSLSGGGRRKNPRTTFEDFGGAHTQLTPFFHIFHATIPCYSAISYNHREERYKCHIPTETRRLPRRCQSLRFSRYTSLSGRVFPSKVLFSRILSA